jgi:NADH-quinone oxidoreductase subunit G
MTERLKDKKEAVKTQTVTLTIDGQTITVPKGKTVLEAAQSIGINIPTFCWHPKLKSVGACRMCYVEVEKMGKLQVSCMLEVMEGMVVHTDSDEVRQGRKAIIEFILLNHPLDCPTCDKGGECDLQNLTFAHGFDDSRYDFQKNRFIDDDMTTTFDDRKIGPEIILNRNRCILCYKCVRANKEAFGEYDLGAYERGNITEINSAPGEQVDNPFSGNLVEICPVGALTNSDWRYKIRVWLTQTTPSICNFTSSGTNIIFYKEEHQNHIFRVTSRPNGNIDDGWLSDITRYGYQIVTSPDRLKTPLIKKEGKQVKATWEEAIEHIFKRCNDIKEKLGGVCIGGLASPHLDNKSLYSFSKMIRTTFKSNNIDFRGDYRMLPELPDSSFGVLRSQPFTIAEIDKSDVIVSFGSDMIREHPNEYLRIRKAFNKESAKIYSVTPYAVKTADVANLELVYNPGTDETVINGICLAAIEENLIDKALAKNYLSKVTPTKLKDASTICGVDEDALKSVARSLASGERITFLIGELVTRSRERDNISNAILNLNRLFDINNKGQIAILSRYANSKGAEKLGLLPKPIHQIEDKLRSLWGEYSSCPPKNTDAMLALIKKEEIKGLFVFGANPMMLYPDYEFVKAALEKIDFLVVADMFESATTELADVVLPLASWAEYDGDYINLEGVLQTATQAIKPINQSKPAFEICQKINKKFENDGFDDKILEKEMADLIEVDSVLSIDINFEEVKPVIDEIDDKYSVPMYIIDDSHHSGHLTEKSPSLMNFTGEAYIELSPQLADKYDIGEGDSVRVETEIGKVIVPAKISEILDNNVVLLPRNFPSTPVTSLFMRKKRVDRVKLTKVTD